MTNPFVVTRTRLADAIGFLLGGDIDLRQPEGGIASDEEFARIADGAVALFATAFDEMDAAFIKALPGSIKLIASIGVGTDHIDLDAASAKGIMVSNTPEVTTACLADATFGLILAACRRFREGLDIARTGEGRGLLTPESWGQRVSGRTLGIIGMGHVGKAVAKRAAAFDMPVLYTTPRPSAEIDAAYNASSADLDTLLAQADIVSIHCPYKPETHHLVDAVAISRMKTGAVLINISRGAVVDELALIDALKSGKLFAAGLDVFETEPGEIREELHALPNVFCTPHIASATMESRMAMAQRAVQNVRALIADGAPTDRVA